VSRQGAVAPRVAVLAVGFAAVLAACGAPAPSTTATPIPSPSPTAPVTPTPSPSPPPAPPLLVTLRDTGPAATPWTALQLTLVGEDGTVAASVNDPGGVDGDAYTVGSNHVYFIEGTTVKAMGRDGTITDAGQVPQLSTTAKPDHESSNIAFAVSPDESTLVFGIPRAIAGDNGSTIDDSQLWTEPVGGTAASATMVYDNKQADGVLLPFAWRNTSIWVSVLPTSGLGGAGPFLDYSVFNPHTFNVASHVLTAIHSDCTPSDARAINSSSANYVCRAAGSAVLKVVLPSGTRAVTMQPGNATGYGSIKVSDDGRYLAYGAYIGDFDSGHYVSTIVDLRSGATAATMQGYTPKQWLSDDRLVVSPEYFGAPSYLLSAAFASPVKIASDQPVGALP
jgi:hypothetical protein